MEKTGSDESPPLLWLDARQKTLLAGEKTGKLLLCWTCPCCHPKVIASYITNGSNEETRTWWLTGYRGEHVGLPGARWRLRDVGEAHHSDRSAGCSGVEYYSGEIDKDGKLTGLPDRFVSSYSYNGYMELQQGCVMADGSVKWPCPN